MAVAVITGGSRGLGRALAEALAGEGWTVVIDGRDRTALEAAARSIGGAVVAVPGDVTDPAHREQLVAAARAAGGIDVLVNNASILGPSPQPSLGAYPLEVLRRVYEVNVVAPLALTQEALPVLRRSARGRIVNITSDASVEPYEGWGGYGSSKAALDQLTRILGAEERDLRVWAVDPGDMRTQMHQEAFPGEDISDRPLPEEVVPALVELLRSETPSGRVRLAEVVPV
jgi:NAD(P)-dependent dehydrogenase (short-subunit alcohol dehydrogenase family)